VKRFARALAPLWWTLAILVPVAASAVVALERVYGVPLDARSLRFERPEAVVLVAGAVLALCARGWLYRRRTPRLRVSRANDLKTMGSGMRGALVPALAGLRAVVLALLAGALMGPQSIHARDTTEIDGIDIVLALDLSLSMQAADIKPDRFRATLQVVDDFVTRRPNDRIGAVIFGRDAYTLLPLTTDHQALRTLIGDLRLGMIEGRGTAIGNALGVSLNRLRTSHAKSKVVILATDGDSNSGNVSPPQAAEFARALGVKVYTILMGAKEDAPAPSGVDLFGRPVFDRGNFPINPKLLEEVAKETGGESFEAGDRQALEKSFHTILDHLERSQIEDAGRIYGELFPLLVAPAIALLFLELFLAAVVVRRWP
jgi:Ca-activated chloride channel family protein